ncbi:stalk domain-containing protein [Brevibacillus laterosporus]|uniref:stalk domain-containing protein n=1 Tax=Brevibacillus laterosporus TaxID=1465 RepID=UPI00265437DA|nr:stalk domain-containing protein [Brevibacillus laterosporus]MDN9011613.1 stalk domain-containing protein [Brevibacillus laterosporus]MDO0942564.1 stalk domain-containing protein [Brevibacillus laterosporus]
MKKTLLSAIVLGMTLSGAAGVYAGSKLEKINAYLNHGIIFKVNGTVQSLTDSNGKKLVPITYQNTTYLPVQAISNMTGINVGFDAASQQIRLETKQTGDSHPAGEWTTINYNEAQIKAIKEAYANFESFETAYAPKQMAKNDSYVKAAASGDGVNLIFKHMTVNVSPRDYSTGYKFKEVKLSNGVSAKWYTPSNTPLLGFKLDDRTVTISSPDGSLSSSQIEQVAVSVAELK